MLPFLAVPRLALSRCALLFSLGIHGAFAAPPAPGSARTGAPAPSFHRHQFTGGVGQGATFEKDVFNSGHVGHGYPAKTDPALRLAYHYNLDSRWSLGLIMHGYVHEFNGSSNASGDLSAVDFDLKTYNRGVIVQRYFSRGQWQPYVYGMLTLASGSVKAKLAGESDKLAYEGYSFGGGAGVLAVISKYIGLSLDAGLSLGKAEWDEPPFVISDGDSFSPSYGAVTANVLLLIP